MHEYLIHPVIKDKVGTHTHARQHNSNDYSAANSQSHGDVLYGLAIQHINGIQTCVHTVPIHKSLTSLCTRL